MKELITLLFVCSIGYGQKIKVDFVSTKKIYGTSENLSKIFISSDSLNKQKDSILIESNGAFVYHFKEKIRDESLIMVWGQIKDTGKSFTKVKMYVAHDEQLSESEEVKILESDKKKLENTILVYHSQILNTNFTIPIARFNLANGSSLEGNVSLFTSIGAGVGYSFGRLIRTRDNKGDITDEEFISTFSLHAGVLFSSQTGEDTKNVFAPVFNVGVLDFQLGVGYEFGTITEEQKRIFFTLSYSIPTYKLFKKSYKLMYVNPTPSESLKSQKD